MSEAIISRRGYGPNGKPQLYTQTITGSTIWTVPATIRGNVSVLLFGAGGGNMGAGGWMNNGSFKLSPNQKVTITIGVGGSPTNRAGGSSAFGTYLSATGGSYQGGSGGAGAGIGYQFGGGGGIYDTCEGGNGGIWGGGGGGGSRGRYDFDHPRGGNGGQYGGGGGSGGFKDGSFAGSDQGQPAPGRCGFPLQWGAICDYASCAYI